MDADYIMKHGDSRLDSFPFMQTPVTTVILSLLYLLFVMIIGPYWMRERKAYELRYPMFVYNAVVVVLSTWIFVSFAKLWITKYNWRCESVDYSNDEVATQTLFVFYVFFLTKFVEFIDTVFFVLRKKTSQITFLHVFHHTILPVATWYTVKYSGGGSTTICPLMNSFAHMWMYSYYGLSSLGPAVQKYLFWKKYITILQLVQFVIMIFSTLTVQLFPVEGCNARNFTSWIIFSLSLIFFILFFRFYNTSYKKNEKPPAAKTYKTVGRKEK